MFGVPFLQERLNMLCIGYACYVPEIEVSINCVTCEETWVICDNPSYDLKMKKGVCV